MSSWTSKGSHRAGRAVLACCVASLLLAVACEQQELRTEEEHPRQTFDQSAARMKAADIPDSKVTGKLGGEPFTTGDVRVHVIKVPGAERVDLIFAEREVKLCGIPGQPIDDHGTRMWIRLEGRTSLPAGISRIEGNDHGKLLAHYERWVHDHWVGIGHSATLLVVDEDEKGITQGRVRACFDDGQGSCVAGRFRAKTCRSAIDLDMLGERSTSEGESAR